MITVICSKHVEDTLSEINYQEKVCILLVFLTYVHHDGLSSAQPITEGTQNAQPHPTPSWYHILSKSCATPKHFTSLVSLFLQQNKHHFHVSESSHSAALCVTVDCPKQNTETAVTNGRHCATVCTDSCCMVNTVRYSTLRAVKWQSAAHYWL